MNTTMGSVGFGPGETPSRKTCSGSQLWQLVIAIGLPDEGVDGIENRAVYPVDGLHIHPGIIISSL